MVSHFFIFNGSKVWKFCKKRPISMTSSRKFWSHLSHFLVIGEKFMWFLVILCNFLSFFMLTKWNFAVILSDKWVVKNKFLTSLHYSFWRSGQENFSIIRNCGWFSTKLRHYQCPKLTFKLRFSWLLLHGLSQQHSIIGKK